MVAERARCRPPLPRAWLMALATLVPAMAPATVPDRADWDGRRIVLESLERHQHYPYVYEEQSMVLEDARGGRQVRQLRRFSRVEADGTVKVLLVLDYPPEVRGVALLSVRQPDGDASGGIYLPALGPELRAGDGRGGNVLGTDFALADLTPEAVDRHRYERREDRQRGDLALFVVDALPADPDQAATRYGRRRLVVRQDNLYVVETAYYDHRDRLIKRETHHDLKAVDGAMWRAGMVLMENLRQHHRSLIKVKRRVFSRDYVPAEMFTPEWVLSNRHLPARAGARLPPGNAPPSSAGAGS